VDIPLVVYTKLERINGHKIMKEYVNNIPEAHLIDAKNPLVNEWHP